MTSDVRQQTSIEDLTHRFEYHAPTSDGRRAAHAHVRGSCLALARTLHALVPDGREKAIVITKIEEAMFWANAALARQPDSE